MRDYGLRLKEKTVVIHGPVQVIVQSLASLLADLGADVAMVHSDVKEAQRFAAALNDGREVRADQGRAMAVESALNDAAQARDVISRVAESFGSIDALIDVQLHAKLPIDWSPDQFLSGSAPEPLQPSARIAKEVLDFLQRRQRGRIIWLSHETLIRRLNGSGESQMNAPVGFAGLAKKLAADMPQKHLTFNALDLGLTEEFLLAQYPRSTSIQAAKKELSSKFPNSRLLDAVEVSQVVAFLTSPMSSAINGQAIRVGD